MRTGAAYSCKTRPLTCEGVGELKALKAKLKRCNNRVAHLQDELSTLQQSRLQRKRIFKSKPKQKASKSSAKAKAPKPKPKKSKRVIQHTPVAAVKPKIESKSQSRDGRKVKQIGDGKRNFDKFVIEFEKKWSSMTETDLKRIDEEYNSSIDLEKRNEKIESKISSTEGCQKMTQKKYKNRPSPPYPARPCCGKIMKGNDGFQYESRPVGKKGSCRWFKMPGQ